MEFFKRFLLIIIISVLAVISCKKNNVEGIIIAETLYNHQNYNANLKLRNLIEKSLQKDENAFADLINTPCGGAAVCYDLGFIVTQIIYRLSEYEVIQMLSKLDKNEMQCKECIVS